MHLLAVAVSLMVRLHLGGRFEGLLQGGFLVSLLAIGLSTVVGYNDCMQMWPFSAATLALMIILAVFDYGSDPTMPANLEA